MCGIVGKFNLNGAPVEPGLIKTMTNTLVHRGPDDSGVHVEDHVGLGHRRLSILDLSELGHQPMASADGHLWVTYNGEIYNYRSVRDDLKAKGYHFKSNCDTEVLLALYQEYGEGCLEHVRGMFAFAIWDKQKQNLFLARDRIGKKPLFYYYDGSTFIFASEIKAIMQDPTVKKQINYEAVYDYFKYLYIPSPKTIYKNIYKLEPGHALTCSRSGINSKQYWDISFQEQTARSVGNLSSELLALLQESVNLRMISDVPLGAFLSGGIDSSSVVALMANTNGKPVTTCSIGFDSRDYDEVRFARQVAERFHTDHHEFTVKQNVVDILRTLARHFDEPFADSSAVPTYYVSKIARQAVTVALAGDGGDENFAGYDKYRLDAIENKLRRSIPGGIRRGLLPVLSNMLAGAGHRVLQKGTTLVRALSVEPDYGFYLTNTEVSDALWQSLINEETARQIGDYDPFSVMQRHYHKADTDDHLCKILYTDLKCYLPDDILVKVDRMSMAHGLEVRAPLLDHNVIEFAAGIPPDLKYNNGEKKYILKQTFRDVLPHDILYRKKMGFSVPLAEWFRGEIKSFSETCLFADDAGVNVFFRPDVMRDIWDQHQARRRNYAAVLWSLLMFELWYQEFMT